MNAPIPTLELNTDNLVASRDLERVRTRRLMAFAVDFVVISALILLGGIVVFFLGILTFGLGFGLYAILVPAVALLYNGVTLAAPSHATYGMRLMGIRMRLKQGGGPDFLTAAMHAVLFYVSVALLTPFVLLFSLMNGEKRLLHDMVLGSIIVRSD